MPFGISEFQLNAILSKQCLEVKDAGLSCHPCRSFYFNYDDYQRFCSYCCLLLPRCFGKSCEVNEKAGRGGGDRTHDLRLKRPLLYH